MIDPLISWLPILDKQTLQGEPSISLAYSSVTASFWHQICPGILFPLQNLEWGLQIDLFHNQCWIIHQQGFIVPSQKPMQIRCEGDWVCGIMLPARETKGKQKHPKILGSFDNYLMGIYGASPHPVSCARPSCFSKPAAWVIHGMIMHAVHCQMSLIPALCVCIMREFTHNM